MRNVTCFLSIILCLLSLLLSGQSHFRFGHYTVNDGLSQSQPYSILQDSYGYLWIGTQDGLNRFDGYEFKVYKNNPFDSTTLTHNWVWTIEEDSNHDLWIGTFQGLCKYKRSEDRFQQFYNDPKNPKSISGNRSNYILKDNRGRLWISSWGAGINLYNPETQTFTQFLNDSTDENSISSNAVRTLFSDHKGNIWVGTWNAGLNLIIEDEKGIRFRRYRAGETGLDISNRITSIAEDNKGNLWIASYQSGLVVFNPETNTSTRIPDFTFDDVNKVVCDSKGNVWIGSNSGLHIAEAGSDKVTHLVHDVTNPEGISSNTIYAIYEDRSGIIWVSGNGIDLYNPEENIFKTFNHHASDPASLSQNLVWSFCEDEEGKIWIGTEAGPINVFDPATETFRQVVIKDKFGNLAQNVRKISYRDGVFWLATFGSGLVRYEKATSAATFYLGKHPSILGKASLVNEVHIDNGDGTLWVSTNENGLVHFNPLTDSVTQFQFRSDDPTSIGSNFINTIKQDNLGNIWVGFWGGGMSRLNKKDGLFTNYRYDRKNPNGLSDQVVISITQENDSIFWICTHTGLNRLNVSTGDFDHFFEKDGLPNNVVYEMLKDDQGNFWISTNKGLSRFDPLHKKFKNFSPEDGLQSGEFNSNAALKSVSGDFYFGGINGFNVFRPEDLKADTMPANLVINSFRVFDEDRPFSTTPLDLAYHENYLSFEFAAIEFSAPEKIRYAYKLDGFDHDWVDASNNRFASYTNLDPGNYTFHVRAANPDGYWSEKTTSISFTIHPPFWKTWWFSTIIVLLCTSLVYSVHRYRLAQLVKVERLRNKIASDLHDEVGSSLTRISIYSDLVQSSGTEEVQNKNYLRSISELSREIVGTMSDIVWSIDNRNDSTGALILRMKDFANEVLQAKNIEMSFIVKGIDESKTLDPALKQNLYLIFKESVNNIVKHAQAHHVSISMINQRTEFALHIHDDGRGFANDGSQKGNGLRNMHRRAEAIGGLFAISSQQGTTILVTRKSL